jgi:hypothetical protein
VRDLDLRIYVDPHGAVVTFNYFYAPLDNDDGLIVAVISVQDEGGARAYTRQWPLHRWSVPTQRNTEAKFVTDAASRERFRVEEET